MKIHNFRLNVYCVLFLCSIFCYLLNSCKQTETFEGEQCVIHLLNDNDFVQVTELINQAKAIPLETPDGVSLSTIVEIRAKESLFYIKDDRKDKVFVFDKNGKYISVLSKRGQGGDEYLQISDFDIFNNHIYVLSRPNKKIFVYDASNRLSSIIPLTDYFDFFRVIDERHICLYSNFSNETLHNFLIYDTVEGKFIKKFLPFEVNQSFSIQNTPFSQNASDEFILTLPYDYNLYHFKDNDIQNWKKIFFETPDKLPIDDFRNNFFTLHREFSNKRVVKQIQNVGIMKDMLFLTFLFNNQYHLTRINLSNQEIKTATLKYNDEYPFIISPPLGFENQSLIFAMNASDIAIFKQDFPSDKKKEGKLDISDNPVLFIYSLSL